MKISTETLTYVLPPDTTPAYRSHLRRTLCEMLARLIPDPCLTVRESLMQALEPEQSRPCHCVQCDIEHGPLRFGDEAPRHPIRVATLDPSTTPEEIEQARRAVELWSAGSACVVPPNVTMRVLPSDGPEAPAQASWPDPSTCSHTGIGLPGCNTCDPLAAKHQAAARDDRGGFRLL